VSASRTSTASIPTASARQKEDPEFKERARKATAELQNGRFGYRLLWRHFVNISRVALEREFHALGVDFDLWKGESDVQDLIAPMVSQLEAKGLLVDDQGARIVRVARPGETKKKKLPDGSVVEVESPDPLLVVSSEGSAMYGTTDLATILDRRKSFDPHLILYAVDQRQADHFEQVFRAAYLAGYAEPGGLEHIGFGTMNGADGKPFKTRAGGVLKLHDLIEMAREKARERLREAGLGAELSEEAFEDIAHKVGVAALKFADLQNFRGTSYVFDLDRFTSFEGKTGPYLLYQSVRIKSILRKAAEQKVVSGPDRRRRAGRARPDPAAGRVRRRVERGLRQEGPQLHRRARLQAGPDLLEVLRRLPDPRRRRAGHPGLAPGPGRDDAEAAGAGPEPAGHRSAGTDVGKGVVVGGGEFVLRRLAIVDRDDDDVAELGDGARAGIIDVEVGDHPAAAVQVEHHGVQLVALVHLVGAGLQRAAGAGDGDVLRDHLQVGHAIYVALAQDLLGRVGRGRLAAGLLRRQRLDRLRVHIEEGLEDLAHVGVGRRQRVLGIVLGVAEDAVENGHDVFLG
jgi:hypothetical protein